MTERMTFILPIEKRILQFFPENARNLRHPEFRNRASNHIRSLFNVVGGLLETVSVSREEIKIVWNPERIEKEPLDSTVHMLQHGRYADAILVMELFLSENKNNPDILYNLGMAYSDVGEIDHSIVLLSRLLGIDPKNVNARVALGVAFLRKGEDDKAIAELSKAIEDDPQNPWAWRNLGGALARQNRMEEAVPKFEKAVELNPSDERAWFGLGQSLEETGKLEHADAAYLKVLELDDLGEVAELARQSRSRISQKSFRSVTPEMERLDAVMYLLSALEMFDNMSEDEVQKIGFEVAMLGTKGIDVNDPTPKYQLKTLPGSFSGLHLLCLEYAAFKQFSPSLDISFDLSQEYRSAQALHERKNN